MRKSGRFMAIAAALALLTGCGGNDASSQQESSRSVTEEASAPEQTADPAQQGEAPAGVTTTAGGGSQSGQTVQDGNGGVDLVSEKYSDFDDVFKLNGEWCSLFELGMTADEFRPEGDFSDYTIGGVVGERVILEKGDPGAAFFETYTFDLKTNELKKICDAVDVPVVAIGGIHKDNILQLKGSGADGVALVSAIFGAEDIEAECRELKVLAEKII